jgi:hypothetical protein
VAPLDAFHVRLTCAFPAVAVSPVGAGGGVVMVVESLAFAVDEPPPETLTWFTCGELAFDATFTVTVIAG